MHADAAPTPSLTSHGESTWRTVGPIGKLQDRLSNRWCRSWWQLEGEEVGWWLFLKEFFFAAGGAVGCVGRLWWARTETVWGFGGRGWGREIGRPPLDNSAKLWVTPLLLGAACNITSNSSDKHQHRDKEFHSLPILKPFTRGKVWPHCELADVYQYCVSDNSQDCRLGFW